MRNSTNTGEMWDQVKEDAISRLGLNVNSYKVDDLNIYSFPQTWPSTALGHGGMGGAAMTDAQTHVVLDGYTGDALVYFGGRYCYTMDRKRVMDYMPRFRMPSKRDYEEIEAVMAP